MRRQFERVSLKVVHPSSEVNAWGKKKKGRVFWSFAIRKKFLWLFGFTPQYYRQVR